MEQTLAARIQRAREALLLRQSRHELAPGRNNPEGSPQSLPNWYGEVANTASCSDGEKGAECLWVNYPWDNGPPWKNW
jgi:hypothetical protein